jgi:hypothetical protein
MKWFVVALAAVSLVAPAVLGLTPSTASANSPSFKSASINIHNSAQLVTTPTPGVDVTVDYSCSPTSPTNTSGTIFVDVSQNGMFRFGAAAATCDDKTHLATVLVSGTFTQGAANAFAEVFNANGSVVAEQFAEITIK